MDKNEIIVTSIENKKLLDIARALPKYGRLKVHEKQLVYLDIDNRFINELCPLIEHEKVEKPDYFSMGIGAHISIIYPNETMKPIFESNQIIHFQIANLFKAETSQAIYYGLVMESPDLIKIRKANNLSEQMNFNGYIIDIHATIGKIKKRQNAAS